MASCQNKLVTFSILSSKASRGSYLFGVRVARALALLLVTQDLASISYDFLKILKALLNVLDIQALLASHKTTLGTHGGYVLGENPNNVLKVVDNLL